MEVIAAIVGEQGIFLAVQGKFRTADAVAIAAHGGAQIIGLLIVFFQRIKAQRHIGQVPVPIGHADGHNMRPEIQHGYGRAEMIGHGIQGHGPADGVYAKRLGGNAHGLVPPYQSIENDSIRYYRIFLAKRKA